MTTTENSTEQGSTGATGNALITQNLIEQFLYREARYLDDRGPRCYPIRDLGPEQLPDGPFKDGSKPSPRNPEL